jgi:hypothetical protein
MEHTRILTVLCPLLSIDTSEVPHHKKNMHLRTSELTTKEPCVSCHYSIARSRAADGRNGLQLWRVAANEYIEEAAADRRQRVDLHLGGSAWS